MIRKVCLLLIVLVCAGCRYSSSVADGNTSPLQRNDGWPAASLAQRSIADTLLVQMIGCYSYQALHGYQQRAHCAKSDTAIRSVPLVFPGVTSYIFTHSFWLYAAGKRV